MKYLNTQTLVEVTTVLLMGGRPLGNFRDRDQGVSIYTKPIIAVKHKAFLQAA